VLLRTKIDGAVRLRASALALTAVLSKSTTPAVSKALALEYAVHNIRFNTVSPGIINTPKHEGGNHETLAKFHPLARMGEISDIVGAVPARPGSRPPGRPECPRSCA
jgi:NAD(P)-dependent dehydrogenase (short-subunit alcohol dehydrogenase family)